MIPTITPAKPWYLSKTIWVNMLMAVFAVVYMVVPASKEILTEANVMIAFSVINVVLRAISAGKIELW